VTACYGEAVPISRALRNGFLFLISLVASGCAAPRDQLPAPSRGSGPTAARSIALGSLSSAVQQAHFAFRPHEGSWIGGDRTYRVRADLTGTTLQVQNGRSLLLGRTSIARDGVELAATPRAIESQSNGGIALDRGVARETLENTRAGVEQSWQFDAAPPGNGGLVVRVPVQGAGSASRSDRGLRFGDPSSAGAAVYSDATWVDARGNRTTVPVSWRQGAIEIDVPSAVVSSSSYPAVLDPTVGPEFVIATPSSGSSTPLPSPAVAYTNGIYLVAWGTVGARVRSSDGVVLDPAGFELPSTSVPSIVGSGGQFFVVWADGTALKGVKIRAVDGAILDPGVVTLSQPLSGTVQIAVTASSTQYLVGWMMLQQSAVQAYVERVRPADLQVLDASPVLLPGTPINQIAVASDGTDFVAFYNSAAPVPAADQPYGVTETRIGSDGGLIDPDGIAAYSPGIGAQFTTGPQVTYAPSGYAVTYVWDNSMVTNIVPCGFGGTKQSFRSPAITFDGIETLGTLQDFGGGYDGGIWVGNGPTGNWVYSVGATCSTPLQLPGTSGPVLASNGAGQTLAAFQDTPNIAGVFMTTCDAGFCGTVATSDDGGVVVWPDAGGGGIIAGGDAQAPTDASDDRTIGSGSGDASDDGSLADASSALDSGAGSGEAGEAEADAGEAVADAGQVSIGPDASSDAGRASGGGGSLQGGSGCQMTSGQGAPERGSEVLAGLVALAFVRRRSRRDGDRI
jgi:hypothetical protein